MKIVVTGASKGIGYEIVKQCLRDDTVRVLALSRHIGSLQKLKEAYPHNLDIISFDLQSARGKYNELASLVKMNMGGIDVLINNAGLLINKPFEGMSEADFDRQFDVNVKAPFVLIQSLMGLFNTDAHIVNISSMGGFQGSSKYKGLSLYSASKGALAILTECLASELEAHKVYVNCLALGAVQTEMLAEAFPGYEAPVTPAQMASFIIDFAFKGSRFFNGKIIPVTLSNP